MPALNIATFASATVMGAQVYEEAIASRAQTALDEVDPGWTVGRTVIRSIRSPLEGNRRLPMGMVWKASPLIRREIARVIFPRNGLTHRMKVGIPPSPYGDVLTLHDVTPWLYPDELAAPPAAASEIRRADAIVTVSEFSAHEIAERFGVPLPTVIPNGIDQRLLTAEPLAEKALRTLGLSRPYVLVAGGASERKNLDGLAGAWSEVARARPDLDLAMSGPEHPRRTALFRDLPRVHLLGRVPVDLMPGLLAAATTVVVPSLYEGFGLPALEGMAVGVPVVAARTSSLPEVVGDGGVLVDPTPAALAEGILHGASGDPEVLARAAAGRARAEQFTWEQSARRHAMLWTSLRAGSR